ncbi:LGFP repeat-containing protein [Sphaerisporangium rhizosphaerae]|uniref:LGFP repeat-containing protein n=2 Tax=Sphaerisporangium rhizosphaerae TaxID=2269375 RepID=A0ABW2P7U9_9ACTN
MPGAGASSAAYSAARGVGMRGAVMGCAFSVGGLVGDRWQALGAESGPFGCPVGPEMDLPDGARGRRQSFERGEIAWMPDQEMVISVFRLGNEACFEWTLLPTSDLHYDYFRFDVLYRRDTGARFAGHGHANMKVHDSKKGRQWLFLPALGEYAFQVKGCDNPTVGSEESRQGWTGPVHLTVGAASTPDPGDPAVLGRIADRWQLFGGVEGPLGRPVDTESDGGDGARMQTFEHGVITTFPLIDAEMAVVAHQTGGSVEVHWGHIPDAISMETRFEATPADSEHPDPEFGFWVRPTDLDAFRWAFDGYSSGYFRFSPGREGVDPRTPGTPRPYRIRITDFVGHVFQAQVPFVFHAFDVWLDPPAVDETPHHAFAAHSDRLDAVADHFLRTRPVDWRAVPDGEDVTFHLFALLHSMTRDPAHRSPGRPRSSILVALCLRAIVVKKMGTDGDYDMTLKGLMTVVGRYSALLSPGQLASIIDDLVPEGHHGGHNITTETHLVTGFGFSFLGAETENHQLMIESCRFLVNQALFERTGEPIYDSLENGLRDWLLIFMHNIAKHDFMEFNSRSYQRLSVHALLNLQEFSTDSAVKTGAGNLLDFAAVKFAVSSSRLRHVGPFRRQKEELNRPDDWEFNDLYWKTGHPQTGFFLMYLGRPEASGKPSRWFPDAWVAEALIAGTSSYRPPAAAYLLALTPYPASQHVFFQGRRPTFTLGEEADPGVEIYYKSPSFVVSAGGMFLNSGYGSDEHVQVATGTNGVAIAQSTALLPTRADVTFADLIRFDRYPDIQDKRRPVNTGVHEGFACGANLRIPERWLNATGVSPAGPWFVLNLNVDLPGMGPLGFYVAAFRAPVSNESDLQSLYGVAPENVGFFYAVEADTVGIDFETFEQRTLGQNSYPGELEYGEKYTFHAPDGPTFTFLVRTEGDKYQARVLSKDDDLLPDFSSRPRLVDGPHLLSPDGFDGYIEIRNPGECRTALVLDYRDPMHPARLDNSAACPQWDLDTIAAFGERARYLFEKGRYDDALRTTKNGVTHFQNVIAVNPGITIEPLRKIAEMWLGIATAAHPGNIPVQRAAADNAWEILRYLATRPGADEAQRALLAPRIAVLTGLLAFGSPTTRLAGEAAALVRHLYGGLTDRDHRLDIAASWTGESLFHHEVSFNPGNPDPVAEQLLQRTTAAEAAAVVFPMARSLPDPSPTVSDLQRMADILTRLLGLLTYGGPDSAPSVEAAELARFVYAHLTDRDHRIDIAAIWAALSLRHHETSVHPQNPDPKAEQLLQRRAAAEAAAVIFPLAEALPDPSLTVSDLRSMADMLDKLTTLLTFGAPTPPDPETVALQALSTRAATLRDHIRALLGTP